MSYSLLGWLLRGYAYDLTAFPQAEVKNIRMKLSRRIQWEHFPLQQIIGQIFVFKIKNCSCFTYQYQFNINIVKHWRIPTKNERLKINIKLPEVSSLDSSKIDLMKNEKVHTFQPHLYFQPTSYSVCMYNKYYISDDILEKLKNKNKKTWTLLCTVGGHRSDRDYFRHC